MGEAAVRIPPDGHYPADHKMLGSSSGFLFLVLGERWRSLFVAAVFCVHPAFVPIVGYISGRADLLGICFALLAIVCVIRYAVTGRSVAALLRGAVLRAGAIVERVLHPCPALYPAVPGREPEGRQSPERRPGSRPA